MLLQKIILPFLWAKIEDLKQVFRNKNWQLKVIVLDIACLLLIFLSNLQVPVSRLNNSIFLSSSTSTLHPLNQAKSDHEVFGFAPFWTIDKLENVDFDVLTTLSYFGIPVLGDGSLDQYDQGYVTFSSREATKLFTRAHSFGTRVVLTLIQMDNYTIEQILDNPDAQRITIEQSVNLVDKRGIDGINVDFEYQGDPGKLYRDKFSKFVADLTSAMHQRVPNSKVTVSVYASAIKEPKIYDISNLANVSDGIFMMAYDFGVLSSENAVPTAPLYGYKEGKYWYDVSTAVEDFLAHMPSNKLILGVPWYGYNYSVYRPEEKAETHPYYSTTQTYSIAKDHISPNMPGIIDFISGWDNVAKVGWKAYQVAATGSWRMIFLDDVKSLGIKYDFAKKKKLGGVGIWALGFDEGKLDFWNLLREKFGSKLVDVRVVKRGIQEYVN